MQRSNRAFQNLIQQVRSPARLIAAGMAIAIPLAGSIRFSQSGGFHDTSRFLTWLYVMPMYFIAPFWAYARLTETRIFRLETCAVDCAAFAIAASRALGPIIPASGHMVLLVYSLLTTKMLGYRIACWTVLVLSMAMKLLIWHDFITSTLGLVVALGFVVVRRRVAANVSV